MHITERAPVLSATSKTDCICIIIYSPTFLKQYRKLTKEIQRVAEEKEGIFRAEPFDSRLKAHKLHGRLLGLWAFSITGKIRIIFGMLFAYIF